MKTRKPPRVSEKEVGALCDDLAVKCGWDIQRYEQSRPTMIALGLPDRRYIHRATSRRVWVELKASDGKLTEAQHTWLAVEISNAGAAVVLDSPVLLGAVLDAVAKDRDPVTLCAEAVADFVKRGYRAQAPKRPRRPRLPR